MSGTVFERKKTTACLFFKLWRMGGNYNQPEKRDSVSAKSFKNIRQKRRKEASVFFCCCCSLDSSENTLRFNRNASLLSPPPPKKKKRREKSIKGKATLYQQLCSAHPNGPNQSLPQHPHGLSGFAVLRNCTHEFVLNLKHALVFVRLIRKTLTAWQKSKRWWQIKGTWGKWIKICFFFFFQSLNQSVGSLQGFFFKNVLQNLHGQMKQERSKVKLYWVTEWDDVLYYRIAHSLRRTNALLWTSGRWYTLNYILWHLKWKWSCQWSLKLNKLIIFFVPGTLNLGEKLFLLFEDLIQNLLYSRLSLHWCDLVVFVFFGGESLKIETKMRLQFFQISLQFFHSVYCYTTVTLKRDGYVDFCWTVSLDEIWIQILCETQVTGTVTDKG